MTVPLSTSKVRNLLKYYFSGWPQPKIAMKLGIAQGSVSHWATRFSKQAEDVGLLNAAKEWNMLNEIQELRAIVVELYEAGLTTADASAGAKIIKKFNKLGVKPEQHDELVGVCGEVHDSGFVSAALKLHEVELKTGQSYGYVMSQYQKTIQELPIVKGDLAKAKAELENTTSKVARQKKILSDLEDKYNLICKKVKETIAMYDKEVTDKMAECEVTQQEIDQVAALKAHLTKQGLDIATLMKLAKEFTNEKGKY